MLPVLLALSAAGKGGGEDRGGSDENAHEASR
jgi:hypothetical protein